MQHLFISIRTLAVVALLGLLVGCQPAATTRKEATHDDLVALFREFDQLRKPQKNKGIPDYTAQATSAEYDSLKILQERYDRMDTTGWSREHQIDYRLVGAHMHGLEFNHRILHRWASDPAYYSTIGWFNPTMEGAVYLPPLPLPADRLDDLTEKIEAIPAILEQARGNLTQMKPDLAILGIKGKTREEDAFREWIPLAEVHHPELAEQAKNALKAITGFREWLEEKLPSLHGESGIGIENYNWLLKNVYLSPYTWEECITLTERELERSLALLKMEEFRNRNLPPLPLINDQKQFDSVHRAGQAWLIRFIRENDILPQPDYLQEKGTGRWSRPTGRNFFEHVLDRDPLPLLPHDMVGHTPDARREEAWNNRPIPRAYDPFYVSGTRAEALATGMEENLMSLGMLDSKPRSRELTYMLRIFRAIRALADLRMHSNEFTLEEAMNYAMETVPYGWYNQNTYLIWEEMDLYMRQPGYGAGYLMGSVQFEQLMARQALKLGTGFSFKSFMERFLEPGLIPISLIEWSMEY